MQVSKKIIIAVVFSAFLTLVLFPSCSSKRKLLKHGPLLKPMTVDTATVVTRTLIVWYDQETGKQPLLKACDSIGAKIIYEYSNFNAVALRVPDGMKMSDAVSLLGKVEGVIAVNRDRIMHLD